MISGRSFGFVLCLALLAGCSSVRIQTGPASEREAAQSSEERGQGLRSQWADQLGRAKPLDKMWMVRQYIDSTGALLLRIGRQISDQWRQGEVGRGVEIPPDEMRRVIENSVSSDQPLLNAYDDMVDYGINEVRFTNFFDEETLGYLLECRDHYDRTHSEVLYPSTNRLRYNDNLESLRLEAERLSAHLISDILRY
ncbi:MAG: hypothetical protein GY867_04490 [bacterium]|nr:hypothetical protein [bacterium]